MVPRAGLEPAHPKAPPPEDGVSANSTTWAHLNLLMKEEKDWNLGKGDGVSSEIEG
jgi:hypothetical protein